MKFGALILAAGYSSRMGDFKPLMTIGGKSLLAHCVHRFNRVGIQDVFLVTGHRADELKHEAEPLGVHLVHNKKHDQGMFSSVIKGVKQMRQYDGFFLLPVDIPLFHATTLKILLKEFDGDTALIPVYRGDQGHPPLIPGKFIEQIIRHDGNKGLRGALACLSLREITVWDRGILLDADTPKAFEKLEKRFAAISSSDLETEEAEELARQKMSHDLIMHCKAVAAVAMEFAEKLNANGSMLNASLLYNGALLHDVAKGQEDHEQVGREMMRQLGCERIGEIVGCHRSTPAPQNEKLTEKELVCLADKFIKGTAKFSLHQRFDEKLVRFAGDKDALAAIGKRYQESAGLYSLVEKRLGTSVNKLVEQVKIV